MTDALEKIKELTEKQHKAQLAAAKVTAQIDAHNESIEKTSKLLKDEYGVTFEDATDLLEKLRAEEAELLAEAEKVLGGLNL